MVEPEMQVPDWIDPNRGLILTPRRLKGLNHPIRLRLLELLRQEGPATATGLAARIGQSSGVTSYHLRVLGEHEFIVEDTERGNDRDRFWHAPHRAAAPWQLNDFPLRLTVDEAKALAGQINQLIQRYRRPSGDADPRPGTILAYLQFQLILDDPGDPPPSTDPDRGPL